METINWYQNTMTIINWSPKSGAGQNWYKKGNDSDIQHNINNSNNHTQKQTQKFNNKIITQN